MKGLGLRVYPARLFPSPTPEAASQPILQKPGPALGHGLNESPLVCRRASLPSRIQSELQTADPGRGSAPRRYTETRNSKPETRNPKPETRNSKPETRNPKPQTPKPEPGTRSPKPETRQQEVYRWEDTHKIACAGIKQGDAFRSWLHYGA